MSLPQRSEAHILIVEDDPSTGTLVRRLLDGNGHTCSVVPDAGEANRVIHAQKPELVVCDIHLPDASGLDLVREVHASHPDTAVVMMSGIDDPQVAEEALSLGAYGYITKPFTSTQLVIGVANALRRRALEIENRLRRELLEDIVRARTAELRRSHEETLLRLAWAAEFRDRDTGRHIDRMGRLCELLALKLGLRYEHRELIRLASPLHDLGKIGIPDRILLKPGALTPAERRAMRTHTEIGHRLLSDSGARLLDVAAEIALTHHERVDGTGYPRGLAGDAIPLEGRIAAVADVFDALTSERVYRPAFSQEEAIELMRAGRGTQFDADLLDLFLRALDDVRHISATPTASVHSLHQRKP